MSDSLVGRHDDLLKFASDIVAAYVSNNPIPVSEIPHMIKSIHSTLGGLSSGIPGDVATTQKPAVPVKKSITPGICDLPGRRQETQNAEALSALALRALAGGLSREMGPARRLSDGRAELCGATFRIRQENRSRPNCARQEIAPSLIASSDRFDRRGGALTLRRVVF